MTHLGAYKPQLVATIGVCVCVCVTNLGAWGTRFPTDLLKDPLLSSVIYMVAPTWFHGANCGSPSYRVTEDEPDVGIYTF